MNGTLDFLHVDRRSRFGDGALYVTGGVIILVKIRWGIMETGLVATGSLCISCYLNVFQDPHLGC